MNRWAAPLILAGALIGGAPLFPHRETAAAPGIIDGQPTAAAIGNTEGNILQEIDNGSKSITADDAKSIASDAQMWATSIRACVAGSSDVPAETFCIDVYAPHVTAIRDSLSNHGIEISELDNAVNELKAHPTNQALAAAARLLQTIANGLTSISAKERN